MTNLEIMLTQCKYWDGLYGFSDKTNQLIDGIYPFAFVKKYGTLFSFEDSLELKSDEELLLKKAVTRIGKHEDIAHITKWIVPVKIFFHEKSDKVKLYHGLTYDTEAGISTELSWITINGKLIDISNKVNGVIPAHLIYYGVVMIRKIVNDVILKQGTSIVTDGDNILSKPNATTVLMKSLKQLTKHYGQLKNKTEVIG